MPKPAASKKSKAAGNKAWSGRFTKGPDPRAEAYSSSLEVDIRLLPYDITGSLAHADMLGQQAILAKPETQKIQAGLKQVLREWEQGKLKVETQDEDVHMLVERRLHELIGPVAGKLHTARSRNDQVITDMKLYLQDEIGEMLAGLRRVQQALCGLAEKHMGWIMPGYTHMQVAQPVLVSHWLLAHLEAFYRDEVRLQQLLATSLDVLPLGAAALAGTSHPIDRKLTASLLGFSEISANSMDTVGDRDFCVEFLSAASLIAIHASRLAEELVWFSSSEFRFITMDQGFATGSSIMPQKRNPDIAELIRGRSGRVIGDLVSLLLVLKGLPLTYNRDLQEDKEPVFHAADSLLQMFIVLAPMLETMTLHQERMEQACANGYPTATEAADHLVRQGVPFREAHAAVGRAVTQAAARNLGLEEFSLEEWRQFHPRFQAGILSEVRLESSIARKHTLGSTGPGRVRSAIKHARQRLFAKKRKG